MLTVQAVVRRKTGGSNGRGPWKVFNIYWWLELEAIWAPVVLCARHPTERHWVSPQDDLLDFYLPSMVGHGIPICRGG